VRLHLRERLRRIWSESVTGKALKERIAALEEDSEGIRARLDSLEKEYTCEGIPAKGDYDLKQELAYLVFVSEELTRRAQKMNNALSNVRARMDNLQRRMGTAEADSRNLPPHQRPRRFTKRP
jgi:chromosome segregation ATPase